MGNRNREIESKWFSTLTMEELRARLEAGMGKRLDDVVAAQGIDTYWAISDSKFIRVRAREGTPQGACQMTVKSKDRESNQNRVEIDVDCSSPTEQTIKLLTAAMGEPTGALSKRYWVYWLRGADEHTNISLYTIKGHDGTFVEFEASTKAKLEEIESKYLPYLGSIVAKPKSLYELFILPKKERFVL